MPIALALTPWYLETAESSGLVMIVIRIGGACHGCIQQIICSDRYPYQAHFAKQRIAVHPVWWLAYVSRLFCPGSLGLCCLSPVLRDYCNTRHPLRNRQEPQPPTTRCDTRCWLGKPVNAPCYLAVPVDMGNIVSRGSWLGVYKRTTG